jgi:hypothetical protein
MEYYFMPPAEAGGPAASRQAVLAALTRHKLAVLRTETESEPDGLLFWRLVLDDQGTRLHFQERGGQLTFATLEHYMVSDPTLVDATGLALQSVGWQVDEENVG